MPSCKVLLYRSLPQEGLIGSVRRLRWTLGPARRDFRGWLCSARGTPASTGHCASNPNKSWEEMTWTRTFGFLAEKTRFRSSLMAHEFVLDLSNCSGPQNTQVSLSETLQMFHFKGSCTQLGEAAGQSSPQKCVATPWLQPLLKQPTLGWCFLHYHASALLQSTLISSQHFFASKKSAIRASGEHPVIQRGELFGC